MPVYMYTNARITNAQKKIRLTVYKHFICSVTVYLFY